MMSSQKIKQKITRDWMRKSENRRMMMQFVPISKRIEFLLELQKKSLMLATDFYDLILSFTVMRLESINNNELR